MALLTTLPAWSRPVGALPGEMHHLKRWGAGGGGRARSPASPDSAAAAAAAVEGRDPALSGASVRGRSGTKAGERGGAGRTDPPPPPGVRDPWLRAPPPTPGPARRGTPPHLFPSRPPLPPPPPRPARARGRLASASGLRPQTPGRAAPGTRGPSPRTSWPRQPAPGSLVRPLQSARPPSPSPHPWARPSHSGPGTLAPPPAQSLTGPAGLGPAERGRVSTPPAPGRRLRRHRARCRSLLGGRSPATPRVRSAARRPGRIAAGARGP